MSNGGELLQIDPVELQFPFELKKQISCSMQLTNKSDDYVAFKVKTTNPKKYCVRPNTGIVMPHSSSDIIVTMQAQKEAPPDMQCKDKFLLQSVAASPGTTAKDITPEMFNKELGKYVEDCKLKVVYVPPQVPSPVREGSEEGSSPRATVSENGAVNTSEFNNISRAYNEQQDSSSETKALVSKLTEEKISVMQQNYKLQQELELLRRERNRSRGGIPTIYVLIIALLGVLLGYLLKKTFGYIRLFLILKSMLGSTWILLCPFLVYLDGTPQKAKIYWKMIHLSTKKKIVRPFLTPTVREMNQKYMTTFKPYTDEETGTRDHRQANQ